MPPAPGRRRPHVSKPENIVRIPESIYGPCPVCGAATGDQCPADCPGTPPAPPPARCVCESYEHNPPADRRLPALHQALHAAQTAYNALFDETCQALGDRKQPPGDFYHSARRAADELDDAIGTIGQTIDDVSAGRI